MSEILFTLVPNSYKKILETVDDMSTYDSKLKGRGGTVPDDQFAFFHGFALN